MKWVVYFSKVQLQRKCPFVRMRGGGATGRCAMHSAPTRHPPAGPASRALPGGPAPDAARASGARAPIRQTHRTWSLSRLWLTTKSSAGGDSEGKGGKYTGQPACRADLPNALIPGLIYKFVSPGLL